MTLRTLLTRLLAASLALLISAESAVACPVCFGAGDGPLAEASGSGIAALLGVTVVVLGAFAAFFLRLRRLARSTEHLQPTCVTVEQSEVV